MTLCCAAGGAQTPAPDDSGSELPLTVALPRDQADDLELIVRREPIDYRLLEPTPWQVAVYFDQLLSDPLAVRNATVLLAARAEALTALGPVEIVLGGETVRSALPPSGEPQVVSEALAWLRLRESSADVQGRLRRGFVEAVSGASLTDAELAARVAESVELEAEAVRVQREGLLLWAAAERRRGPRLLIVAGSGHDADLVGFYRDWLVRNGRPGVELPEPEVRPTASELGRALAITGWTVLGFTPGTDVDALLAGPTLERPPQTTETPDGRVVERAVIPLDVSKLLRREEDPPEEEPVWILDPKGGLRPLAEATAGEVVSDPLQLDRLLEEMGWRAVLAVRAPAVGEALPLEVRARGLSDAAAAPRWIGSGAPAALSFARARSLAVSGETADGDLELAALVTGGQRPRLAVELSSAGGDTPLAPPLRLTVARASENGTALVAQRLLEPGEVSARRVDLDLEVGSSGERDPVIVVVDELGGDRWGGTFASFTSSGGERGVDPTNLLDLPRSAAVRLLAPLEPLLVGRVRFAAAVSDPEIVEVEFLLDGEREAVRRSAPFEADLDLGTLPRTRRVEVIARDRDGDEVGRDALRINSSNSELSIQLLAPEASGGVRGSVAASDSLLVEARVDRPQTARVAKVDFYWVDRPIGTLFAPPFRQRIALAPDDRRGFVRAVVTLADGASAEDVLFVNSAVEGERVDVTLVEVLAIVTDDDGRPVTDLTRDAFAVSEQGRRQEIATFNSAGEVPLTLGLAVDSSASMFIKLPKVQLAAIDFLRGIVAERDRGFVVGFGREARLLAPTTGDVGRLVDGVAALRPEGFTSIWKGIVYSLVQLQGTPGKKALVVYSDGADEDPDFSYRTARRFARLVGVPIYVILSNNEIVRTEGRGLNVRGFLGRLEELVNDVGGRLFFTRVGDDLEGVYGRIAEELRSQYLLGYYGATDVDDGWRRIEVEVDRPGLEVRSTRGRYP